MIEAEPVALFDLDGTLADFDTTMKSQLEILRSPGEGLSLAQEEIIMYEDVPYMKARRRLVKSQPGFWRNLPPLKLGFQILDVCRSIGFKPHVLTKGPAKAIAAYTEKVEWCKLHLPGIPVTISDDKGLVYGRVLVDDWPPYIRRWVQWRPRGLVVAVAHRWNEGIDKELPNVIRYRGDNLDQVFDALKANFYAKES
jgi:5'-nucleotidase